MPATLAATAPMPPTVPWAGPAALPAPADTDSLALLDDPLAQRGFCSTLTDASGRAVANAALRISGMHCAACAVVVEQAVARVAGVQGVQVSASGARAQVRWFADRTRLSAIVAAIRSAGYDAAPDTAVQARTARTLEHRQAVWRLFVAAFCGMQVMMLATPSYVAVGDELAPDLRQLLNWGSWLLSLPVLVFAAGPFFSGAWQALRQRRIGMDVPVALGVAVTFMASSGATFAPGGLFGSEVYFDSLTMFVSFLLAGRLLETRARHRVAQVLEGTQDSLPQTALRLDADGQARPVSVLRLVVGDVLRVPVGQAFAADGELTQGSTIADESLLTGESTPVPKPLGASVVAGSINLGAPVLLRVQRLGDDTRLAAIVALMRSAMAQRPGLAQVADRWAAPFLWAVLLLAAGAAAVWSQIDPSRAVWVAVSVLIVTCPCALSLAAPSAMLAATSALAQRGVLLQRLDALQALARLDRIYLDKTGTLTDAAGLGVAMQRLAGAAALGGADSAACVAGAADAACLAAAADAACLARAASLAAWSSHPLSAALVAAADAALLASQAPWRAVQELPGQGLQALDSQGRCWRLGQAEFVAPGAAAVDLALPDAGRTALWWGTDGRAALRFDIGERLRPDAVATVAALRQRGLQVLLLSGDQPQRAEQLGRWLAVDGVVGGATPERKLAEVAAAQAQGQRVAMVGDGINDAPVLARADVSVAMGQGALLARTRADAVLASGRLGDIVLAIDLARRTMAVVRQNMLWAAAYNAVCIPLALLGWLPPWAAGLGMACSSLLVVANALRLARPLAGTTPAAPAAAAVCSASAAA